MKVTLPLSLLLWSFLYGIELSAQQVSFHNVAQEIGLNYLYNGPATDGAGISLMDIDDDGLDDLSYGTHNTLMPALFNFVDDSLVTMQSTGLEYETNGSRSMTWVDYDNDGDKDLCITNINSILGAERVGTQKLYRRDGPDAFTDVTYEAGWGLAEFQCYSAIWADIDNDGWLDCYQSHRGGLGTSYNRLLKNNGDGTFSHYEEVADVVDAQGLTYSAIFFDYDLDGDVDLYVSNDKTLSRNTFYENDGTGHFTDISEESGIGIIMDGMGLAAGDYDNNGYLDLYVANTWFGAENGDGGNRLFHNNGDGTWDERADYFGVEVNKTCWGMSMADLENDGDLDLIAVSEGGMEGVPSAYHDIFINHGDSFTFLNNEEIIQTIGASFGSAIGDVNDDGYPDMAIANSGFGAYELWLNTSPQVNNWIKFNLNGTISNYDAIGSLVEVWVNGNKQIRYTTCGNSYGSQDSDTYIVGLGQSASVDSLIVQWPSGLINRLYNLPGNRRYDISEAPNNQVISCLPNADFGLQEFEDDTYSFWSLSSNSQNSYTWSIDGVEYQEDSLSYQFTEPGEYEVCLLVENDCSWNSSCQLVEILCPNLSSTLDYNQFSHWIQVELDGTEIQTSLNGEPITLGAGGFYNLPDFGDFELCVRRANHCDTINLCDNFSYVCAPPVASAHLNLEDLHVDFYSLSQGADYVEWYFGDGNSELEANDNGFYKYDFPGDYNLCIIAYNDCGSDTACYRVRATCSAPQADFGFYVNGMQFQASTELYNNSVEALWIIDDEMLYNGAQIAHQFESIGVHQVCLELSDVCGTDSHCEELMVGSSPALSHFLKNYYPNPVIDEFFIELKDQSYQKPMPATMRTLDGRPIRTLQFNSIGKGLYRTNMADILTGSYILELRLEEELIALPIRVL